MPLKTEDGHPYQREVVEIHPEDHKRLANYAQSTGRTKAYIFRKALAEYLDKRTPAGHVSSIASRSA